MKINFENFTGFGMSVQKIPSTTITITTVDKISALFEAIKSMVMYLEKYFEKIETNKSHFVYHFKGNINKMKIAKQVFFENHSFLYYK